MTPVSAFHGCCLPAARLPCLTAPLGLHTLPRLLHADSLSQHRPSHHNQSHRHPPTSFSGRRVLDLGSGSGRDCYVCAALVGELGSVTGVDMTAAQLEVARKHAHDYCTKVRMIVRIW